MKWKFSRCVQIFNDLLASLELNNVNGRNNKIIERGRKVFNDMVAMRNDKVAKLEEVTKERNDARNDYSTCSTKLSKVERKCSKLERELKCKESRTKINANDFRRACLNRILMILHMFNAKEACILFFICWLSAFMHEYYNKDIEQIYRSR